MRILLVSKSLLIQWALPIALILTLAASFAVADNGSGDGGAMGSDDFAADDFGADDFGDFGDFNPAYEDVTVGPVDEEGEEGELPMMLYSLDVETQATVINAGSNDLMTLTLTNLIEEPIANGTYMVDGVPVNVTEHGDIGGTIAITADVYAPSIYVAINADANLGGALAGILSPAGVLVAQSVIASAMVGGAGSAGAASAATSQLQALPAAFFPGDAAAMQVNEQMIAGWAELAAYNAKAASPLYTWTMTNVAIPVINFSDGVDGYLTCHPGRSVVVQAVLAPLAPVWSILFYRAALVPDQNVSVLL